jgi:hypothetical protein
MQAAHPGDIEAANGLIAMMIPLTTRRGEKEGEAKIGRGGGRGEGGGGQGRGRGQERVCQVQAANPGDIEAADGLVTMIPLATRVMGSTGVKEARRLDAWGGCMRVGAKRSLGKALTVSDSSPSSARLIWNGMNVYVRACRS